MALFKFDKAPMKFDMAHNLNEDPGCERGARRAARASASTPATGRGLVRGKLSGGNLIRPYRRPMTRVLGETLL